jgi:DNA topoisomerase-1
MDKVEKRKLTEEKALKHSKRAVRAILKDLQKHTGSIGKELVHALKDDAALGKCSACKKGSLVVIRSRKTGKRFVGCNNYPKCTNSYPLPQTGRLENLHSKCKECSKPMIRLIRKRKKPWVLCVNPDCPSKDYLKNNKH